MRIKKIQGNVKLNEDGVLYFGLESSGQGDIFIWPNNEESLYKLGSYMRNHERQLIVPEACKNIASVDSGPTNKIIDFLT